MSRSQPGRLVSDTQRLLCEVTLHQGEGEQKETQHQQILQVETGCLCPYIQTQIQWIFHASKLFIFTESSFMLVNKLHKERV